MEALRGKTILVTGGTGSFGSQFVKHVLAHSKAEKVIIFSRDELKQHHLETELRDPRVRFFLGDVRDLPRLQRAFHGVDIVVHAAALKQVPALEYNPFEAVKTNIFGSQNIIEAAIDQGVKKVVLVSTDKAAMPVNLYGSTKLCAEKLFISANSYSSGGAARFSVVRYGNVIGSRGSVVEKLIKDHGAPSVLITDERMTRFWIGMQEAFDIVLFAIKHMEGGEIYVPRAASMKLTDLFDILAPKAKRKVIGIRPGEKLHEVLLTNEEARHAVSYKEYFVIHPENVTNTRQQKGLKKYAKQGKALAHDFHFTSDTNEKILSKKDLLKIVEGLQKEFDKTK